MDLEPKAQSRGQSRPKLLPIDNMDLEPKAHSQLSLAPTKQLFAICLHQIISH